MVIVRERDPVAGQSRVFLPIRFGRREIERQLGLSGAQAVERRILGSGSDALRQCRPRLARRPAPVDRSARQFHRPEEHSSQACIDGQALHPFG